MISMKDIIDTASVIAVVCILALIVASVSAVGIAQPAGKNVGPRGAGDGSAPPLESIIDRLNESGVNVSEAETALESGDNATAEAWLKAYVGSHAINATFPALGSARRQHGSDASDSRLPRLRGNVTDRPVPSSDVVLPDGTVTHRWNGPGHNGTAFHPPNCTVGRGPIVGPDGDPAAPWHRPIGRWFRSCFGGESAGTSGK